MVDLVARDKSRRRLVVATLTVAVAGLGVLVGRAYFWVDEPGGSTPRVQGNERPESARLGPPPTAIPEVVRPERAPVDSPPREFPPPGFFPRPPDEWQGMLVSMVGRQLCEQTSNCGLALSCRSDGMCGPCEDDRGCGAGEACVLDHCLRANLLGCRSRKDCASAGSGALCVLTGPTGNEVRGNSKTHAYCSVPGQPVPGFERQDAEHHQAAIQVGGPSERQPVAEADLLKVLRSANEAAAQQH
jgi:hypothetical protein